MPLYWIEEIYCVGEMFKNIPNCSTNVLIIISRGTGEGNREIDMLKDALAQYEG